ncbi:hypothetical protein FBU30_005813 [Linnemannia zychae]|nr:hypothetical protein FBU30_005813 [Linnemannia zychae]
MDLARGLSARLARTPFTSGVTNGKSSKSKTLEDSTELQRIPLSFSILEQVGLNVDTIVLSRKAKTITQAAGLKQAVNDFETYLTNTDHGKVMDNVNNVQVKPIF